MTVIWDFNGTILDDTNMSYELTNKQLINFGYKPMRDIEHYKDVFCFPIEKYYKDAGFNFDDHPFDMLAKDYAEMYTKQYTSCALHKNIIEVLEQLKQKNIRQIILSASEKATLEEQLDFYGITQYFDTVLGLDDVYAKSKVEMAKQWMKDTNFDGTDAIYVGDTTHDFEVANQLGVMCVLYAGGHQNEQILKATGAHVVTNLSQVLNFIK